MVIHKGLEPTAEQVEAVAAAIASLMEDPVSDEYRRWAVVLWPLIRDMVLEAAERECETIVLCGGTPTFSREYKCGVLDCQHAIRALKGTP